MAINKFWLNLAKITEMFLTIKTKTTTTNFVIALQLEDKYQSSFNTVLNKGIN